MLILVYWCNDWFCASKNPNRNPEFCGKLQGANNPKYESMGFKREGTVDLHYYKFFEKDPGFRYFTVLKYKGYPVAFDGMDLNAISPSKAIIYTNGFDGPLPEANKWDGHPRHGYTRSVKIEDLEKIEIPAPNWCKCPSP